MSEQNPSPGSPNNTTNNSIKLTTSSIERKTTNTKNKQKNPQKTSPSAQPSYSSTFDTSTKDTKNLSQQLQINSNAKKEDNPSAALSTYKTKIFSSLWSLVESNMLFKLGFHNKSPVELLLENDDCTLEQILDEEDVISEAKAHYGKLIDFLAKSENLTKMIDYITIEIPLDQIQTLKNQTKSEETEKADDTTESEEVHLNEEKLQKRIFKYPRIAAEILCCDIDALYSAIVSDKLLLTSLFDFISHEKQTLNPQLTNYWIRVVTCLVQRKPIEVHKFIMSQGESFVLNFCKHIGVPGMDELLLKLISCELYDLIISAETNRSAKQQLKLRLIDAKDNSDATNVIKSSVKWWTDAQVPFKLIEKLSPQYSSECHINVTRVLSEIIRRSLQYNLDIQKLNPLATSILSDSVLCKLMDTLLENVS